MASDAFSNDIQPQSNILAYSLPVDQLLHEPPIQLSTIRRRATVFLDKQEGVKYKSERLFMSWKINYN